MEIQITRTEEDVKWAKKLIALTIEEILSKSPQKEPYYKIKSPEIKAVFPNLSEGTLKRWCIDGKLGKLGADKKFYVQISEIEKVLFVNNKK